MSGCGHLASCYACYPLTDDVRANEEAAARGCIARTGAPDVMPPRQEFRNDVGWAPARGASTVERRGALPADSAARKEIPLCSGLLDYFPAALAEVARVSKYGNDKHNPGEPLHHARGKSMDHADCIGRHLVERGGFDGPMRHSACLAWRALALLQEELEAEGAPLARGAWLPDGTKGSDRK